ncbi:MAG: type II toxin-antitoxin system RelE/ParE family toxin [Cyanobacteria bacterium P01_G01_bin.38]
MKIEFRKSFEKDLRKIKDKSLLGKIKALLAIVEAANSLEDINNLKKIKAEADYYRIRIGDYRIGFLFDSDKLIFIRFLHRKDIYKYFP